MYKINKPKIDPTQDQLAKGSSKVWDQQAQGRCNIKINKQSPIQLTKSTSQDPMYEINSSSSNVQNQQTNFVLE